MDRILFGDNQFFGVNHISDEKARQIAIKFKENKSIIDILEYNQKIGLTKFVCSTRPRIAEICNYIRKNEDIFNNYEFYPMIPDVHKYNNELTELGINGIIKRYIQGNVVLSMLKGGIALAKQDYNKLIELLIDAELKMFKGLKIGIVFLQNNLTDLLVGLGMKDVLVNYDHYIKTKYGAEPGYMTMNLPETLSLLNECQIENPVICTSFNKVCFRMSKENSIYEKLIKDERFRCVAMQVLAAGAIPPVAAIEYVCRQKGVDSVLFGASSKAHILETKNLIDKFSNQT